jgi:hypothetical protein
LLAEGDQAPFKLKLRFLAQAHECKVSNDSSNQGYRYGLDCDDVTQREQKCLAASGRGRELAHKQIGVEEENDKSDLYDGSHMRITRRMHFSPL